MTVQGNCTVISARLFYEVSANPENDLPPQLTEDNFKTPSTSEAER
jgi:hypothetical protein